MPQELMEILTSKQLHQKVDRISYQILENNYEEKEIILIGVKQNGFLLAQLIQASLKKISKLKITLSAIEIDKDHPDKDVIKLDIDPETTKDKVVILIDDVANTGRTLTYAIRPFLNSLQKKLQTVVMVDRKHKGFPISADYVGLTLATTMAEHITVKISKKGQEGVYLS